MLLAAGRIKQHCQTHAAGRIKQHHSTSQNGSVERPEPHRMNEGIQWRVEWATPSPSEVTEDLEYEICLSQDDKGIKEWENERLWQWWQWWHLPGGRSHTDVDCDDENDDNESGKPHRPLWRRRWQWWKRFDAWPWWPFFTTCQCSLIRLDILKRIRVIPPIPGNYLQRRFRFRRSRCLPSQQQLWLQRLPTDSFRRWCCRPRQVHHRLSVSLEPIPAVSCINNGTNISLLLQINN